MTFGTYEASIIFYNQVFVFNLKEENWFNFATDTRLDGWPLMDNPLWTVAICLSYIYFAKVWGPRFMEKRPAFELRGLLICYNVFQVLLHAFLFWEGVGISGWFTGKFNFRCEPVDYSNDPSALRIMFVSYLFFLSKYVDMLDTIFFILRKKLNQVTVLHLIHHGLVPFISFPVIRYASGGSTLICGCFNSLEHVIMYTYYLAAVMGPRFQWFLKWKKQVTACQISQFVIVALHSFQQLFVECGYPITLSYWIAGTEVFFFCLFVSFYRKSYKHKTN